MSRIARQGRKTAENRAKGSRFQPACAAAGALALTLALASAAQAQSRSGITVNSDVLNSLGPGPAAAPLAPLAPAAPATPLSPRSSDGTASFGQAPTYQAQPYQAPAYPPAGGSGGPAFQPYGGGNVVVTRPGTLLFPPLEPPTSTLTPGFEDNHAARTEAMTNAFAEGPEPSSQLLIPMDDGSRTAGTGSGDSVVVFMDNLPPVDDSAAAADAPRLTLRRPPMAAPDPAPRKPEVSPEMLAEVGVTTVDDSAAALAPEFQAAEAEEAPEAAPLTEVETVAIEPDPLPVPAEAPAAVAMKEPAPQVAAVPKDTAPVSSAEIAPPQKPMPGAMSEPTADGPVSLLPAESADTSAEGMPANDTAANDTAANDTAAPVSSAEVAAPVSPAPAMEEAAAQPAPGVQTASLTVGSSLEDMTVTFDNESAELTDLVQAELRNLADSLRASQDGRIQVLGFASAKDGSQDLARKLALSRALKVRTFLIDAGVSSTRIQVRSLGDQSGAGPANRVDIRPIDS